MQGKSRIAGVDEARTKLPPRGRVVVDSAPIIYLLEDHPQFGPRYAPFFERAESGDYELIITTVTLAEVLTGPLRTGNEKLAQDYRNALTAPPTWQLVQLTADIAHRAARIGAYSKLRLPDAIPVAMALETSSMALITRDRDFSSLEGSVDRVPVYG